MQKALHKAQIDVLYADDDAFNKAKAQVLCLHPELDLSEMDFFKVVVDGRLIDMEEIEPSSTDDLTKEDRVDDINLKVVDVDKNEE